MRNAPSELTEELLAQGAFAVVHETMGIPAIARIIDLAAEHGRLRRDQVVIQAALDGTKDGISVLDASLTILRANPTMEQWCPHDGPLVGKKCYTVYHGRTEPCDSCPAIRAIATGLPQVEVVPLTTPDGAHGSLQVHATPFHDAAGRVAGGRRACGRCERAPAERRAPAPRREERAAVGQIAAGIAHEFNNIIASIMWVRPTRDADGRTGTRPTSAGHRRGHGCRRGKHITDGLIAFANPGDPRRSPRASSKPFTTLWRYSCLNWTTRTSRRPGQCFRRSRPHYRRAPHGAGVRRACSLTRAKPCPMVGDYPSASRCCP